jgi:glyoxylase-like metal-dependent hydrolase (beta-lactamase superfamily II)
LNFSLCHFFAIFELNFTFPTALAILLQIEGGQSVIWDCAGYLSPDGAKAILAKGPVKAIAISHPHFYNAALLWSRALGGCKVIASAKDREWFTLDDNDEAWEWFEGDKYNVAASGVTVIRCGGQCVTILRALLGLNPVSYASGHFPGSSVLWWKDTSLLLCSDTFMIAPNRSTVSFMWSYPNMVYVPVYSKVCLGSNSSILSKDASTSKGRRGNLAFNQKI